MTYFLAHFLFILAAWTLLIKFVLPVAWSLADGSGLATYIYWDFWWVAHLWLGWALLAKPRYLWMLAMVISISEVIIVTVKFYFFLSAPVWTIWSMNWFVNKVFVLVCFILILCHAAFYREIYRWNKDA